MVFISIKCCHTSYRYHVHKSPGMSCSLEGAPFPSLQTSDLGLRENIPGYPTRFELWRKKESLILQAEDEEEKARWVQDIWDLFFSHMLQLKGEGFELTLYRP